MGNVFSLWDTYEQSLDVKIPNHKDTKKSVVSKPLSQPEQADLNNSNNNKQETQNNEEAQLSSMKREGINSSIKFSAVAIEKIKNLQKKHPDWDVPEEELLKMYFDKDYILHTYFSPSTKEEHNLSEFTISIAFGPPSQIWLSSLAKVVYTPPLSAFMSAYIIIGPYMFGWTNDSLVQVFSTKFYKAQIVVKLDPVKDVSKLEPVRETILKWNNHKHYNKVTANCQHFATEILSALKQYDDKVKQIIKTIKPLLEIYDFNYHFRDAYMSKVKHFYSHADLDEFFKNHLCEFSEIKKIPQKQALAEYKKDQEASYRLLKAIDRVYWLQVYKGLLNQETIPKHLHESSNGCPFGCPWQTDSIQLTNETRRLVINNINFQAANQVEDDDE